MATRNTSINLDPVVKEQAQAIFTKLGLSFNGAINLFLHQVINDNGIPFQPHIREEISPSRDPYFDDPRNVSELRQALYEYRKHKNRVAKTLEELEAMEK